MTTAPFRESLATGTVVRVERLDKPRGGRNYALHLDTGETRLVPSVTTITGAALAKPALIPWAKNVALEKARAELYAYVEDPLYGGKRMIERSQVDSIIEAARKRPDEVRDAAAGFGTQFHSVVDKYLKTGAVSPLLLPEHQVAFDNWVTWQKQAGLQFAFTEHVVWSLRHGFAGTMDAVAKDREGRLVLADWKSSNGIYPEMYLQLGGYALAHEEISGDKVDHAWIVRVSKDVPKKPEDAFEVRLIDGRKLDSAKTLFLAALQLVEGVKEFGE